MPKNLRASASRELAPEIVSAKFSDPLDPGSAFRKGLSAALVDWWRLRVSPTNYIPVYDGQFLRIRILVCMIGVVSGPT
jgi:hypothetical protein